MFLSYTVKRNITNTNVIHPPLRDLAWLNGLGAKALAFNLEHSTSWPLESEHFLASPLVTPSPLPHLCYTEMFLEHSLTCFSWQIIKNFWVFMSYIGCLYFVQILLLFKILWSGTGTGGHSGSIYSILSCRTLFSFYYTFSLFKYVFIFSGSMSVTQLLLQNDETTSLLPNMINFSRVRFSFHSGASLENCRALTQRLLRRN